MTELARAAGGAPDKRSSYGFGHWQPMSSGFLYTMPDFWSGMGSILDLSGYLGRYNYSLTEREADLKAIYSDYRMIGQDLENAMRAYERQHAEIFGQQDRLFDPDEVSRAS